MKLTDRLLTRSLVVGLLLAPVVAAQSQEELKQKYEEKLTHEFIEHGGWITDYDAARAKAKEEDKVIFAYFSRSYSP